MRALRAASFLLAILVIDGAAAAQDAPPEALRPIKAWPFYAWDRAEAVTFNPFSYREVPTYAYRDKVWSPHITAHKPIDVRQAERAVAWMKKTRGETEVSNCTFPRHAVVFYAGATPVASINVCFECGGVLVWPDYEPRPDYAHMSDADWKKRRALYARKLKAYEKVYPLWQAFFRDELGFSIVPPPREP